MIARFFSWVTERQFDDDTPDPDYDPAAVIERWIANARGGDQMNRKGWEW
jgi:hypothetical protein